jgi:uncharacterized protein (TIGR03085 family)
VITQDIVEERARLVETLRQAGPDAPTLAGDWSAAEVAHHLAVQDRLQGVPAYMARRLVVATRVRLTAAYLDRPFAAAVVNVGRRDWDRCIQRLQRRPPAAVMAMPIAAVTLWEHVVHHEDVRRPANIERTWWPDLGPVIDWLMTYNRRRLEDQGVRLVADDKAEWSTRRCPAVTVRGAPSELVIWLSGRGKAAHIHRQGEPHRLAVLDRQLAI